MGNQVKNTKYIRLNHQDIIKDYIKLKSLKDVYIKYNISEVLLKKILINNGVELFKRIKISDINPKDIIKRYEEIRNVKVVSEEFNISQKSVLKILHENDIRVSVIKYTDEQIIEKYFELKTIVATCNELGISETYISKIFKTHNIPTLSLKRKQIGDVFGKLTIVEEIEHKVTSGGNKRRQFILKCECGTLVKRDSLNLTESKTLHCGCITLEERLKRKENKRIREEKRQKLLLEREEKKKNEPVRKQRDKYFVGTVKDRLTILSIGRENLPERTVVCECECGNIKEMLMTNFYNAKSCGCLVNENRAKASTIHGLSPKNDKYLRNWYDRWKGMISRCYNPKMHAYNNYGGRGIGVCDRWREPNGVGCKNYIDDIHNTLGPQPGPGYSLDRIDNNGNYEINNLRWATLSVQAKNQRRSIKSANSLNTPKTL